MHGSYVNSTRNVKKFYRKHSHDSGQGRSVDHFSIQAIHSTCRCCRPHNWAWPATRIPATASPIVGLD